MAHAQARAELYAVALREADEATAGRAAAEEAAAAAEAARGSRRFGEQLG